MCSASVCFGARDSEAPSATHCVFGSGKSAPLLVSQFNICGTALDPAIYKDYFVSLMSRTKLRRNRGQDHERYLLPTGAAATCVASETATVFASHRLCACQHQGPRVGAPDPGA